MHFWTEEELDWLRENYKHYSITKLTPMFNDHFNVDVTPVQIKGTLKRYNILSGRTGHFSKGESPWNKGMKGINFGGENGKKTQFKKGQTPINYRPVGSERINVDGYIEVKVADPNKWKLKHNVIWEEVHGPIPKGHCVLFLDSNKLNTSLENLQLISRSQLVRLNQNGLISGDAELTKTGILVADILTKIGERKNQNAT